MRTWTNVQIFRFNGSKSESLFLQRKNPRKIAWTVLYRRMHKKGVTEEQAKKRTRRHVKHQRGIVGASLDQINSRRNQKPEVREAARKEHIAKSKEAKKARQAERKANRVRMTWASYLTTGCRWRERADGPPAGQGWPPEGVKSCVGVAQGAVPRL